MGNIKKEESLKDVDSAENMEFDAAKPVGGIRATKKVTLEIDIEKTLKYLMVAGLAILILIYGYKGGHFVYNSYKAMSHSSYHIAVLDMQTLRKEFNKKSPALDSEQSKTNFENYFKELMKVYRDHGYLVVDASLVVTIPDNVQIVSYIDLSENFGEVQSLLGEPKESEIR